MKLVVTDRADDDLHEIYRYLHPLNPQAAQDQIADIHKKFQQLVRFPFIGRERSTFAPGLRSVVSGPKVIFYLVTDDRIVIVRVLDGRMDLDEEFRR